MFGFPSAVKRRKRRHGEPSTFIWSYKASEWWRQAMDPGGVSTPFTAWVQSSGQAVESFSGVGNQRRYQEAVETACLVGMFLILLCPCRGKLGHRVLSRLFWSGV